jgi:acetolactate synthase I/II/III large subunit
MVVSRALRRHGVRTVFALAGRAHAYLLDALDRDGVRIVGSRHESGTVGAADGYARITGRIGVALIIADQGLPNAINGIACAFHAASPVARADGAAADTRGPRPRPSTTTCQARAGTPDHQVGRTVPSATRLGEYVDAACKRALVGPPGPVVLQLPQEFLGGPGSRRRRATALPAAEIPRPCRIRRPSSARPTLLASARGR